MDVDLGEAGGADREVVVVADQLDQLARVLEAALGRRPLGLARRRVAAQSEHVLDAGVAHDVERLAQLVHGGADAGEVGHRLEAVLGLDRGHDVDGLALLLGAAAGAVGDRHEGRLHPGELGQRAAEVALALVGLRREELEREGGLARGQSLVDAHAGSLGGDRPALRRFACTMRQSAALEMRQPGERLGHQPGRRQLAEALAVDLLGDLVGGAGSGERGLDRLEPLVARARGWPRRARRRR